MAKLQWRFPQFPNVADFFLEFERLLDTQSQRLPSFVTCRIDRENSEIEVVIDKKGRSEIVLAVLKMPSGTVVEEKSRKIALLHYPFLHQAESFFSELMDRI